MAPTSPWANMLSVGLKILTAFLGGGNVAGDGIDKVDNSSPMQVIFNSKKHNVYKKYIFYERWFNFLKFFSKLIVGKFSATNYLVLK